MEWMVYWQDPCCSKITTRNVFTLSATFYEDLRKLQKAVHENNISFKEFSKELLGSVMYCYWSKVEHEIILTPVFGMKTPSLKIDVYDQLRMNWKHFSSYVWNCMREGDAIE